MSPSSLEERLRMRLLGVSRIIRFRVGILRGGGWCLVVPLVFKTTLRGQKPLW